MKKRVRARKRTEGGGKNKKRFWPRASPPLKRLRKRQEAVCVCACVFVCVFLCHVPCMCGANVSTCVLLSPKESRQ